MARSRNIKPGLFINNELAEIEPLGRLLFIGLWTVADREGRLKDIPKKIRVQVLPYDNCDVDSLLNKLAERGFVTRYQVEGCCFIQINNFNKHQNPHIKEVASEIPPPPNDGQAPDKHGTSTVQEQKEHTTNPADSLNLIPDSLTPPTDSLKPESESIGGVVDPDFGEVIKTFENNLHMLSSANREMLLDWSGDMEAAVIIYAIKQAAQANKRTAKYVNGILRNLHNENCTTMKAVEARERDHTNSKMAKKHNGSTRSGGKPKEPNPLSAEDKAKIEKINKELAGLCKAP